MFQREIFLVSTLSSIFSSKEIWLVDNITYFHMIGARELFDTLTETSLDSCMELSTEAKNSVQGSGIVSFRLKS